MTPVSVIRKAKIAATRTVSGSSYSAATLAYQTRVVAAGGQLIDIDWLDLFYGFLATQSLTIHAAYAASFGLKKDGSNLVSALYDLSSNNFDLAQVIGSQQPVYGATSFESSLPAIVFDAVDDNLQYGTISNVSQPTSYIFVFRPNFIGAASTNHLFPSDNSNPRNQIYAASDDLKMFAGTDVTVTTLVDQPYIILMEFNDTSSKCYVNGSDVGGTFATGTGVLDFLRIGRSSAPAHSIWAFNAVVSGIMTAGQRGAFFTFLNDKYAAY